MKIQLIKLKLANNVFIIHVHLLCYVYCVFLQNDVELKSKLKMETLHDDEYVDWDPNIMNSYVTGTTVWLV